MSSGRTITPEDGDSCPAIILMIPRWLKENRKLGGFVHDGYFIDIGIPEAYYQFIEDVQKGVVVW